METAEKLLKGLLNEVNEDIVINKMLFHHDIFAKFRSLWEDFLEKEPAYEMGLSYTKLYGKWKSFGYEDELFDFNEYKRDHFFTIRKLMKKEKEYLKRFFEQKGEIFYEERNVKEVLDGLILNLPKSSVIL